MGSAADHSELRSWWEAHYSWGWSSAGRANPTEGKERVRRYLHCGRFAYRIAIVFNQRWQRPSPKIEIITG
jgi:hypothetical protein